MKKTITLMMTLMVAICANASIWKANADTPVAAGSQLVDDDLLTATIPFKTTLGNVKKTIASESFTNYIQVRTDKDPTADTPTGTEKSGSSSIVVDVKKDVTVTVYYRRQSVEKDGERSFNSNDGKDLKIFDQNANYAVLDGEMSILEEVQNAETGVVEYGFGTKTYTLTAGRKYTITARGTTIYFFGFKYEESSNTQEATAFDWIFTSISDDDVALLNGDITNWEYDSGNERWSNLTEYKNAPLTAIKDGEAVELAFTKGLTFTAGKGGKLRLEKKNKRLSLNGGNITVSTPSLKAGQVVTIVSRIANKTAFERRLIATNLYVAEGFGPSKADEWITNIGVVAKDGPITITTNKGGINLQSISVSVIQEKFNVTVGEAGWATFTAPVPVSVPEGLSAYIISQINSDHVLLSSVTEVPAHQAIVVKGDAGKYAMTAIESAAEVSNQLSTSTDYVQANGTQYALANGNKGVGFYRVQEGEMINGGKGFLKISDSSVNAFTFGDADGISTIEQNANGRMDFYNLQGMQVAHPTKGIYIVNGKKVIIR